MIKIKKIILLLVLSLILTSCSIIFPRPKQDELINVVGITGENRQFILAGLPSYIKEKEVYRNNDEKELAMLSIIQESKDNLKVFYVSENKISINRTFSYIESIIPYTFNVVITEIPYSRKEEVLMTLFSIEIKPNHTNYKDIFTSAKKRNETIILPSMTHRDKIKSIHDKIVSQTKYDTSIIDIDLSSTVKNPSFEATGVFNYNTAVCSGYARAFNTLAHEAGIPSLMVSSIDMVHAWNLVYDGLNWRFIDTTFNDPIPDRADRVLYTYYLLSENQFTQDGKHRFDKSSDMTLSASEYIEFAEYVYPETKS